MVLPFRLSQALPVSTNPIAFKSVFRGMLFGGLPVMGIPWI
jgi:hypothetical protein